VVAAVGIKPARCRELFDVAGAQIEVAAVEGTGDDAAIERAHGKWRGHVRTTVVGDADACRAVRHQNVQVAVAVASHRSNGQRGELRHRDVAARRRTGCNQALRDCHDPCLHLVHRVRW
jgi:hypothetical protein